MEFRYKEVSVDVFVIDTVNAVLHLKLMESITFLLTAFNT